MNTAPAQVRAAPLEPKPDLAIGLVTRAWHDLCMSVGRSVTTPTAVVPIKSQRVGRKSGVYRLEGVGEGQTAVIAKRCALSTATVERVVYERVLPRVGVTQLRYYGCLLEPAGGFGWLFLEDAGQSKLSAMDGALAAQWLAQLHAEAAALVQEVSLPERGPAHYLEHLRSGREIVCMSLEELALSEQERRQLQAFQRVADQLEGRWESICGICAAAPRTLVHGDLSGKNLRLRRTEAGAQMVALDWET